VVASGKDGTRRAPQRGFFALSGRALNWIPERGKSFLQCKQPAKFNYWEVFKMKTSRVLVEEARAKYGMLKNYVDGEWRESTSSQALDVVNPATGEVIARVPLSTSEEVKEAIAAAQEAFREWRETPPTRRVRYFFTLKNLLEENFEDLSRTVVEEMGKTIDEARGELRRSIEEVECACGIPSLMKGYVLDDISPGIELKALLEPLGVFCMVPPFNFPAMVPLE
jgi:delta 1-pyrroline-5-carboxylate dehydrogenase